MSGSPTAPLRVPVELCARGDRRRWFRMAHGVSVEGVLLGTPLPPELDGAIALRLHLPDDPEPLRADGRAAELAPDDEEHDAGRASRMRAVRFVGLDENARARVSRYVTERLGLE